MKTIKRIFVVFLFIVFMLVVGYLCYTSSRLTDIQNKENIASEVVLCVEEF